MSSLGEPRTLDVALAPPAVVLAAVCGVAARGSPGERARALIAEHRVDGARP